MPDRDDVSCARKERLRAHLDGLSPAARDLLLRGPRADKDRGELTPRARLLLDIALEAADGDGTAGDPPPVPASPVPAPLRRPELPLPLDVLFFQPFEPFLIEETLSHVPAGRMMRGSLARIWHCLTGTIAAELFAPWTGGAIPAAVTTQGQLEAAIDTMRRTSMMRLREEIDRHRHDERAAMRFAGQLGGETAYADLKTLVALDERRPALANTLRALDAIGVADAAGQRQFAAIVGRHLEANAEDAVWLAAAIAGRPGAAIMLTRLAPLSTGPGPGALARSPRARSFMTAAIDEMERLAVHFLDAYRTRERIEEAMQTLKSWCDLTAAIAAFTGLDDDEALRRSLATVRRMFADRVGRELDTALGRVRGAIAPAGRPHASLDGRRADIDDAVRTVTLLRHAHRNRATLGVNEVTTRVIAAIRHALEMNGERLISDLARASGQERALLTLTSGCAIDLSALVFDEDYANQLRRRQAAALRGIG